MPTDDQTAFHQQYVAPLRRAVDHATDWLRTVQDRPVRPEITAEEALDLLGGPLPDGPTAPADVVEALVAGVEPGLMAIGSGRFFGWVMGGTLPAALAADWLVSTWDQNAGMRQATPGVVAAEEAAASWLLDLLGLPATADVGFTTGATMANFACLAAARHAVLDRVGWDVRAGRAHRSPSGARPGRRGTARFGRPGPALSRVRCGEPRRRGRPGADPS